MKPAAKRRLWSGWYTALLIVAGLIFIVVELPQGYSDDLSVIGQGKRVVVVVYDSRKIESVDFLSLMNGIRDQSGDSSLFRVADTKDAKGKAFAETERIKPPALLLFAADGTRLGTVRASRSAETVAAAMNEILR